MYLTYDEYISLGGKSVGESDFPAQVHLAEIYINDLTFGRIHNLDDLTDWQRDCLMLATFFQMEYMTTYGDFIDSPASSFSVGGTSMDFGNTKPGRISQKSIDILEGSGLRCRQLL